MDERAFIHEVARRIACDEKRAEAVTFAVFQELRQRLTPHEGADLAAQMPEGLRKLWTSFEKPDRSVRRIHAEEFIGDVRRIAALSDDAEARRAVIAVFAELQRMVGSSHGVEGEAWHVLSQLPKDLKRLWLEAARGPES
jgi:uncharacterized protein (DUF2267 family)